MEILTKKKKNPEWKISEENCVMPITVELVIKDVESLEVLQNWFVVTVCNNAVCWFFQNYGDALDCQVHLSVAGP